MYHVSPVQIKKITNDGLFGSGLFFGSYSNCGHGSFVYEIENSEDIKTCTATHLRYEFCDSEPEVVAYAEKWEIDNETAFDIITGKESEHNHIGVCGAYDAGWEAQKIALILAMRAGYAGVQLFDENGTVWLVDGNVAIKKWKETNLRRKMKTQHWCMCEKLKAVARDGHSTCSICGGKDAYGLSTERPDDKKKTITTAST